MVSVLLLVFLENNTEAQKGEFYLNKVLQVKKKILITCGADQYTCSHYTLIYETSQVILHLK